MWFPRMKKRVLLDDVFTKFRMLYLPTVYNSLATRSGYVYDTGEWLKECGVIYVDELDISVIHAYFSESPRQLLNPRTNQRRTAAIKAFLVYLEDILRLLPGGFSDGLMWPEIERSAPRPLTKEEYERLLAEASLDTRDSAIIHLLLQTGIRLHELTALTLADVDLPETPTRSTKEFGVVRISRNDGNREVVGEIIVNSIASRALKMYLSVREDVDDPHVFLTKYTKPITDRSVQKLVKKYAVAAGVPWAHVDTLRVTHIYHHLDKGTDRKIIQANTGQKDPATINRYVDAVKEARIRAMQTNAL